MSYPWRVGVDIGGTFTDLVAEHEDGTRRFSKVLTTPGQEVEGVLAALDGVGLDAGIGQLVHGTTLVINALIQRIGARTALVTTRGFRDVIELGRGSRPEAYDLFYARDAVMVPRDLRFEVGERVAGDGTVLATPDAAELDRLADDLRAAGAEAVAVGFIHGYLEPANEELVADALRERLPGVPVLSSARLSRQWREYERFETVAANAYVAPAISDYIDQLLAGVGDQARPGGVLFLDARGGGLLPATAKQAPLRLVESGPVGGVVGAIALGASLGIPDLVTLDVGGTTAKAALIEDGRVSVHDEFWVGGYERGFPVQVPVVDIVEVGAGGGSLAWVSDDGRLQVGPRSAGAKPGPACYGVGGTEATVTDAHVVCGRLGPEFFLSVIEIQPDLAHRAIERLAERSRISVDRLALGILQLANLTMGSAVSKQTVERGRDPRQFTLVACGGAGPLHACEIADSIGIERVLIPEAPGHFSASGMLGSSISFSVRGILNTTLAALDAAEIARHLDALTADLTEHSGLDLDAPELAEARYSCRFSMRYAGQEHTLDVPGVAVEELRRPGWTGEDLRGEFVGAYRDRFGYGDGDAAIEVVAAELEMSLPQEPGDVVAAAPAHATSDTGKRFTTSCLVSEEQGRIDVPAVPRASLDEAEQVAGPAIVYEIGSVAFVPPGWTARREGTLLYVESTGGER